MPKFLNKNELTLLALILLMFDVNGFCMTVFPHVVKKGGKNWALFGMTACFVLYSTFVYHTIVHTSAPYPVKYYPLEPEIGVLDCDEQLQDKLVKDSVSSEELGEICKEKIVTNGQYYSEKIVLTVIAMILLVFVYVALFKVDEGDGVNSMEMRGWYALPVVLMACSVLLVAHVYIPFYLKE